MNQNEVLMQHLEDTSLEKILENPSAQISEVFDDDAKIREIFDKTGRPILVSKNASTRSIKLKEAVIQYQDDVNVNHKLYLHEAVLTTQNSNSMGTYFFHEDKGDVNKLVFLDPKEVHQKLKGNFELDDVYYGKGSPPKINRPVFIKAQKAEINFTASEFSKIIYPGEEEAKIGKIKDGVYDLENVIININKAPKAFVKFNHIPYSTSFSPYVTGILGGTLGVIGGIYLLSIDPIGRNGEHFGSLGLLPLLAGGVALSSGVYHLWNRLKYDKFINLYKEEMDISFIGLLSKEDKKKVKEQK